jgi:hypothetical protein
MASASDNFDRANGGLGANWTIQPGTSTPTIFGNAARADSSATYGGAFYNGISPGTGQWSEVILGAVDGIDDDDVGTGPAIYMSAAADTCYKLGCNSDPAHEFELGERVAGVTTVLDTDTTGAAPATNDVVYLEASAAGALSGKVNGVERVGITDTTLTTGNVGMVLCWQNTPQPTLLSWQGGDLTVGVAAPMFRGS